MVGVLAFRGENFVIITYATFATEAIQANGGTFCARRALYTCGGVLSHLDHYRKGVGLKHLFLWGTLTQKLYSMAGALFFRGKLCYNAYNRTARPLCLKCKLI